MNPKIDTYLAEGCGRCPLGGTPDCKVLSWTSPLKLLRKIALDSVLKEELKWGIPCYTYKGKNVVQISAFKDDCVIGFFKGALLKDEAGLLQSPGENSQAVRQIRFTTGQQVNEQAHIIREFIEQAIEVEKQGKKVDFNAKEQLEYPEELIHVFGNDSAFAEAFEALTPGRKRGYILHISAAKQSATRTSRIQKNRHKIMEGKGLQER